MSARRSSPRGPPRLACAAGHGVRPPCPAADARHFYATVLIPQGVLIGLFAPSMGHSSIALVHFIYGHVIDQMRSTVADAAQKAMFGV